ncbi:MAG: pilus assembly protein PilM [Ruminococcaceae bacterium]|nr:pilus assembly protein PilM [Oscillospiraceae bacterium]
MSIAIDIGTKAMHLVQGAVHKKNQVTIKRAVIEPLPSGMVQDGIIREFGGLEMTVKNMLQKYSIKDKNCSLTINGNHIYSRDVVIPRGKPAVMKDVATFEVMSSMNTTKDMSVEYVVSKQPVPDRPEMVNVRASAMQLDYVNDYHKLLKNCKLRAEALDIHANAITKSIAGREINGRPIRDNESVLVLDLGAVTSSAYIFNKGEIIYSRIIPVGGLDIERFIAQRNEKESGERQLLLDQLDLSLNTLRQDPGLADVVRLLVSTVNEGVQRILQYLASRLQDARVSTVYLCGRTATYKGIDRTLAETFNLQTETIQQLSQVILPEGVPVAPYINAIGALIRQD